MSSVGSTPEALLAAHDRLRRSEFAVVSLVCGHTPLDSRVWLGRWAAQLRCDIIVAPVLNAEAAIAAYAARVMPLSKIAAEGGERLGRLPLLLLLGSITDTLPTAGEIVERANRLPVALTCGIAQTVEHLLDSSVPMTLVKTALQGLVPIADTESRVLRKVAEGRRVEPFLRGACEGLLYYMLQARTETRDKFRANARVLSRQTNRSHEVDLICDEAKFIVEIDGREHDQTSRQVADESKQRDLETLGYRIRRFGNDQVISDPVGVWRLIAEQVAWSCPA